MGRTCATPGCRFADNHAGPHSHERHGKRLGMKRPCMTKTTATKTTTCTTKRNHLTKALNDFQIGLDDVRDAMDGQAGVRLSVPLDSFNGHWSGYDSMCSGKIVGPSYEDPFVAEALFDGETEPVRLTPSQLMHVDTRAVWRKPPIDAARLLMDKCAGDVKHNNAVERATDQWMVLLEHFARHGLTLKGCVVLTLDGIGTTRVAGLPITATLPPSQRPEVWTLEKEAVVALGQRVVLGFPSVHFTGADPRMRHKSLLQRLPGAPTLEDVVLVRDNRILSEDDKKRVVWLNLDYCGGPKKNHNAHCGSYMAACLAHLLCLQMITITIALRNHPNLHDTFDDMVPPPYGFVLKRVYTSNRRVLCKMYVREPKVVRRLAIPGHWWVGAAQDRATYDGVVVAKQGASWYDVYVPTDDKVYTMREDAVGRYATDGA
jgi:hypothetical protein